jgi:hypothetical protein
MMTVLLETHGELVETLGGWDSVETLGFWVSVPKVQVMNMCFIYSGVVADVGRGGVGWKVRCHKSEGIVTMTDPVSPLPLELSA